MPSDRHATETPPPASLDFEPPAYSQPTLPPAPDEVEASRGTSIRWASRWGARLVIGGVVAMAAVTGGAYALLPHATPAASAVTASIAPTHTKANLVKLRDAFPAQVAEKACADSAERIPVVLYSAIDTLRSGAPTPSPTTRLEAAVFSSATPVSGATMTVPGRRIAILRSDANREPQASAGDPMPGLFEGTLVVFDAATGEQLCQAHVEASSAKDTRWANVSPRALRADYVTAVRKAVAESASRLHVELDL